MSLNWQIVATVVCIVLASLVLLRELVNLFASPGHGCQSGCNSCPSSKQSSGQENFVSLETLVSSSRSSAAGDNSAGSGVARRTGS